MFLSLCLPHCRLLSQSSHLHCPRQENILPSCWSHPPSSRTMKFWTPTHTHTLHTHTHTDIHFLYTICLGAQSLTGGCRCADPMSAHTTHARVRIKHTYCCLLPYTGIKVPPLIPLDTLRQDPDFVAPALNKSGAVRPWHTQRCAANLYFVYQIQIMTLTVEQQLSWIYVSPQY